jgi:hypothetical protein
MHSEVITDTVLCPHDEIVRQRCVTEARIYMKLFYNEKEITQTCVKEINGQGFNVEWVGQENLKGNLSGDGIESNYDINDMSTKDNNDTKSTLISVVVNQEPKSIKAEIYEVVSDFSILTNRAFSEIR